MKKGLILPVLLLAGMAIPVMAQPAPTAPADNSAPAAAAMPPEAPPPPSADQSAPAPTAPADAAMAPPPPAPMTGTNMSPPPETPKDYPVCTKTITDECINRSEAHHGKKKHK